MTFKQKVTILIAIIFVVIIAAAGILMQNRDDADMVSMQGQKEIEEVAPEILKQQEEAAAFVPEIPRNAKVSKPVEERVVNEETGVKFGAFDITISYRGFDPERITVPVGEIAEIRVRAEDSDYDISVPYYGAYTFIEKGEIKNLRFRTLDVGTISFECRDYCPFGDKKTGEIVVIPK